jgi:hypothetical protein
MVGMLLIMMLPMIFTTSAEDSLISAQVSTLEMKPNNFAISKGGAFDIDLYVVLKSSADTIGVDYISWDPSLASLDGVERGDIFTQETIWIEGKNLDNTNGTLEWVVWGSQTPSDQTGEGVFAKLKFTALKDGTFNVYIPGDKLTMARNGEALQSTIIGANSPVEKTPETFLPTISSGSAQSIIIIAGLIICISIISIIVIRYRKGKGASQPLTASQPSTERVVYVKNKLVKKDESK